MCQPHRDANVRIGPLDDDTKATGDPAPDARPPGTPAAKSGRRAAANLPQLGHRFGPCKRRPLTPIECVEWSTPVPNPAPSPVRNNLQSNPDLQSKLEKYERKAAQYQRAAQQAASGADRAFYDGLASYC